jgi:drug/metabolite transporter (DMT)-like permease
VAASWWLSLAYLAVAGSVVAFACFLTLQQRLGAGPASTVGVATTVIALAVSTLLEGYRPGIVSLVGAGLTLAGNALCLGLIGGVRPQPPHP